MELIWVATATPETSGNIIFEEFDANSYGEMVARYKALSNENKQKYKGADDFIAKVSGITITQNQKNYKKFLDEIDASLEKGEYLDILPVDMYSEKDTIMDLLASLENENYIKEIYRKKKLMVSGELKTDTAIKLMDSLRQGRSLLQSAQSANMLSKPLIAFYAASAYAYASIVINSPLHKALDSLKGSHGHSYNHLMGTIEFGGKVPSGTFIDLMSSNFLPQIIASNGVHLKYNTISSLSFIQSHKISISLIALLTTVPELHEQMLRINADRKLVHKLVIKSEVIKSKVSYVFEIGDGISVPSIELLESIFHTTEIANINGNYLVTIPAEAIQQIAPTVYQDIQGKLWFIEPLVDGLYMPEICLHFLIISALCNIMRYSPHEWNSILSNKISSEFSLLISKYLRLFELKYPMLITQQLTNFLPLLKV